MGLCCCPAVQCSWAAPTLDAPCRREAKGEEISHQLAVMFIDCCFKIPQTLTAAATDRGLPTFSFLDAYIFWL